jgi:hypothetical protein
MDRRRRTEATFIEQTVSVYTNQQAATGQPVHPDPPVTIRALMDSTAKQVERKPSACFRWLTNAFRVQLFLLKFITHNIPNGRRLYTVRETE